MNIEHARPEDEAALTRLYQSVHPTVGWSDEFFRWKYATPPRGRAEILVIRDGDDIASISGRIPQRFRIGEQVLESYLLIDAMTDARHRGKGYLHATLKQLHDELVASQRLSFGFPNMNSLKALYRVDLGGLCNVPSWSKTLTAHAGRGNEWAPSLGKPEWSRAESLWCRAGLKGTERDAQYLEWRYARPGAKYFFLLRDNAFATAKLYGHGPDAVLNLCDAFVEGGELATLESLLNAVDALATELQVRTITSWVSEQHPYVKTFVAAGFAPVPSERMVIGLIPPKLADTLGPIQTWHITQSDSDVY
jgi:hypothetical protein